jgi:hypothetical protein
MAKFRVMAYVPDNRTNDFIKHIRSFGKPPDVTLDIYIEGTDEVMNSVEGKITGFDFIKSHGQVEVCEPCTKPGHNTWQCIDSMNCKCFVCADRLAGKGQ